MGVIVGGLRSARALRAFALASVVANVVIVVTGGAVRLTSSGLGCPTWPSCTNGSLTPVAQNQWHGVVEFSNRLLTFVLVIVAIATVVLALVQRTERALAFVAFLGIPAQAVLGGISVLTHLNPWVVAGHLLLSMAVIAVSMRLWFQVRIATGAATAPLASPSPVRALAAATCVVTALVLAVGTVVTGSGPHAGDPTAIHRMGFDPRAVSQLHADLVMVLLGLTVGLVVTLRLTGGPAGAVRAAWWLLGAELAQGVVGYVQYFTGLPSFVVGVHMLGACLVWVAALAVALGLRAPAPAGSAMPLDDRLTTATH